jgi:hypothetical protein
MATSGREPGWRSLLQAAQEFTTMSAATLVTGFRAPNVIGRDPTCREDDQGRWLLLASDPSAYMTTSSIAIDAANPVSGLIEHERLKAPPLKVRPGGDRPEYP